MNEMRAIEIDIDVHKLIEMERASFSEAPNTALRRLLKLPPASTRPQGGWDDGKSPRHGARAWVGKGVVLPHGTEVRMAYNHREFLGKILDGKWMIDGKSFSSPSGAARGVAVTKQGDVPQLDGWKYWTAKRPGEEKWVAIVKLRPDASQLTPEDLGL